MTVNNHYLLEEQLVTGGAFVRNDSLSNDFDFTENVLAAYSQYGNKFGDFSFLSNLIGKDVMKNKSNSSSVKFNSLLNKETINFVFYLEKQ